MNDDFNEMARLAAAESSSAMDARIAREKRVQTRARRVRAACRYVLFIGGGISVGCFTLAVMLEWDALVGWGCALLVPALIAAVVLFFMGGLSPNSVRWQLTERDRDLLDH